MSASAVLTDLKAVASREKAAFLPRFFKTGKGQYGEGDVFLGVTVPEQRLIAKNYASLPLSQIEKMLNHKVHEMRLTGLIILCAQYRKAKGTEKKKIVDFYVAHLDRVNNWDLVDSSAAVILGDWLLDKDTKILDRFAKSAHLWTQRVAIVATYAFIRQNKFDEVLRTSELLLHHKHDLIHKAVGWMLREMGKRDEAVLKNFLDKHAKVMPRTMLRYSIERLSQGERERYMSK